MRFPQSLYGSCANLQTCQGGSQTVEMEDEGPPLTEQWCVLRHFNWGAVDGEFFEAERTAMARYESLGMGAASMVLTPNGDEHKYWGLRGGRDDEMRAWWTQRREATGKENITLDKMYCVASHLGGGKVEGEFYATADVAMSCFKSLSFSGAAMVIGPTDNGEPVEIGYWGARGERVTEMLNWWKEQTQSGAENQSEVLDRSKHAPVMLHIYDVVDDTKLERLNDVLHFFGAGAYHAGVEVHGIEWSFGGFPPDSGAAPDQPGIGCYPPRECSFGKYRESVLVGDRKSVV